MSDYMPTYVQLSIRVQPELAEAIADLEARTGVSRHGLAQLALALGRRALEAMSTEDIRDTAPGRRRPLRAAE